MKNLTITRGAFDRLSPAEKAAHFRNGGKLTDLETHEDAPRLAILSRSQFRQLTAKDRSDYLRFGGLIRDDGVPAPVPRPPAKPNRQDASRFDPKLD